MRCRTLAFCLALAAVAPASAFEADTQAILDRSKIGKLMPIGDIASLMMASERWCYFEADGTCQWSDIYLEPTDDGIIFEIGNAWDGRYDIAFVDQGIFKDDRYICEMGHDWVPSVRAFWRDTGEPVFGRELHTLQAEIRQAVTIEDSDCFDYLLEGVDEDAGTITLLQRQYVDMTHDPANDAPVTLHFDPDTARALTWAYNY